MKLNKATVINSQRVKYYVVYLNQYVTFYYGSVVKHLTANAGGMDSVPDPGRSPGGEHGNSRQYSCLGNHMVIGVWQVHGVTKSQPQLSD